MSRKTKRAAHLAKADLLTEVVGEFPELQGLMGKYYALAQGEDASVAAASEEHYKPQGPADRVPTDPVSVAVALADKIDTLVGFLGDRRKADGEQGPVCAAPSGAGGDQDSDHRKSGLRLPACVKARCIDRCGELQPWSRCRQELDLKSPCQS